MRIPDVWVAAILLFAQTSGPPPPVPSAICRNSPCLPIGSTAIVPGQSIQTAVDAAPRGASFLLKAGVHRLQTVRPKDGATFVGEPGAILSGARLLTGFTRQGNTWFAGGQTQEGRTHGQCLDAYPRCDHPEELFLDDVRLRHVGALADLVPGGWFFDYGADRIYIADDPSDRRVEASTTAFAFTGNARNVTIRNITVEKYASPAQSGAIDGAAGSGWTVEKCMVRWNHGGGLSVGPSMQVRHNALLANGQIGIAGGAHPNPSGITVEENEIAYNNEAGFDPAWEAGGAKFSATTNLVVRGNHVHHNAGPGLWTDTDNLSVLYEDNTVEDNQWAGIFHEISYAAVLRNNSVRRNGFRDPRGWYWGAGILVAGSPDVEIYGNTVEDNAQGIIGIQQRRGSGASGPYVIQNLSVHDNDVHMRVGYTGIVTDTGETSVFTSRNNRWRHNTYYLGPNSRYFTWFSDCDDVQWRNYGNDPDGAFLR